MDLAPFLKTGLIIILLYGFVKFFVIYKSITNHDMQNVCYVFKHFVSDVYLTEDGGPYNALK